MKDPSSPNSTKAKPRLGSRVGRKIRSLGEIGRDAVEKPGLLPGKAYGWFRCWLQKVWSVRGGGLYACGYAITFVIFEIQTVAGEIAESSGVRDFIRSQLWEFLTRFAIDSLQNFVKALMWPVYVVQTFPPYGAIALGVAFIIFPRYLKKPIQKWLFAEEETEQ